MSNKYTYMICGAISSRPETYKEAFEDAEEMLWFKFNARHIFNPATLPCNFDIPNEVYLKITFAMIEASDVVLFLKGWQDSPGAKKEHEYARVLGKKIIYEEDVL